MIKLSIQAWMLIKEYCGIYNIPHMDYKLFRNISGRRHTYILETYKKLCNPPLASATTATLYKYLAQGYKSKAFYSRIASTLMNPLPWKCVCNITETTPCGVIDHVRKVDHIIAIKSGKYDAKIVEKFNEDPYLFKYLNHCGFTSREVSSKTLLLHTTFNSKFLNPVLNYHIVVKQN